VLVVILPALTIFALRIVDITMYTMRLMMLVRGRKAFTWVFAFLQSFIYVTALRAVLADLGAPLKVLGYAAGFATGMVVGMWLESRVAIGYSQLRIISLGRGAEIAEHLRSAGYSITEVAAHGRDGTVTVLNLNVPRRQSNQAAQIAAQTDPQAFVTAKSVRLIQRGTSQT